MSLSSIYRVAASIIAHDASLMKPGLELATGFEHRRSLPQALSCRALNNPEKLRNHRFKAVFDLSDRESSAGGQQEPDLELHRLTVALATAKVELVPTLEPLSDTTGVDRARPLRRAEASRGHYNDRISFAHRARG
ncbi:hypothetical protein NPIL_425131 [Nephila pilipes]|uniref:Uncharacterized protein n=1 Tax=Nephila pilipes TaxID=299642 RepID=A0A8X6MTY2_NEPPI|nr:hypothetical protein NPIL_425131 [Nephila pilipes]